MPDNVAGTVTTFFAFLTALSIATERVTETIKGLPLLSTWLSEEKLGATAESARKAAIHIIAIAVGAGLALLASDQAPESLHLKGPMFLLYGAMASGGSGLWNSALDILRETNKQKQALTEKLRGH